MSVHLTPAARKMCGADTAALTRAVLAALSRVDAPETVDFMALECDGVRFALSARLVIDVDHFPHRVPDRILRRAA